ncbi:hypothetical protein SEA_IAMGROOT_38 [Microbacterium phage IAmGroot]|uniref:Uncharacterized protein n=1 Tax=Microbacterium phage IAmGroot TaxID=2588486 RepID=A0A4Y6E7T4_9CAUD|nr:hypothetical protein SEA_IAMGROOT_38 [Microbacterium phage IAmGroot]
MSALTVSPYQRRILVALNVLGKHIFAGTETPEQRTERRREQRQAAADALPNTRRGRRARAQIANTIARKERTA